MTTIATAPSALDAVRRLERELADDLRAARAAAAALVAAADAEAAAVIERASAHSADGRARAAAALLADADADAAAARAGAASDAERLTRALERHRHELAADLLTLILPAEGPR